LIAQLRAFGGSELRLVAVQRCPRAPFDCIDLQAGGQGNAGWNVPCRKPGEDEALPEQKGPLLPAPEQVWDPECLQRFL